MGRNNGRSSDMTEPIYHLIGHKFSQFETLFGHFKNKKLKIILVHFKILRSFINEVEITNPKDIYLPRNISNNNVCVLFSVGHHFSVCTHFWKPQHAQFSIITIIVIS